MPEVFNKTGHGLIDIVIARDKFKAVLHPKFFGGIRVIISTVCLSGTEGPPPWLRPVSKIFFLSLELLRYLKKQLLS